MTAMLDNRTDRHETIESLAAELHRMQQTKRDYTPDTRRMSFATVTAVGAALHEDGDQRGSWLTFDSLDPRDDGTAGGIVNDHAHGQISSKLAIPKAYYDRMRSEAPALLDHNVQHWLHNRGGRVLVRMLDGQVRAFLSDRYRRLDNYDLMERAVIPAFQGFAGEVAFQVASLTPERMILRALMPTVAREVRVGDIVQAGIQIRNSEVGSAQIEVSPFAWRLVCRNGMVRPDGTLKARHVGKRVSLEDESIYRDDTLAADDKAFFLKARDAIAAALDEERFDEWVGRMRDATGGEQIEQPVAAAKQLAQTFSLTDGEQESVLAQLAAGADLSRWGLANAVTAAAKRASSFDRQAELEQVGGELVETVSRSDWRRIAVAA